MKRLAGWWRAKTRERNYEQIYREWPVENKHRAATNPLLLSPPGRRSQPVKERERERERIRGVGEEQAVGRVWQHIITVISGQVIN